ncbi:hypothetical protein OG21DRAFT_1469387 [Imleria badia]|nr:hypothetical protein OG21DRAFT_1469387 [Imleria badia]
MSVRPFSPSESFAFPKPPAPPSSTVDSFFISGTPGPASPQSSATTLVHLSTPPPIAAVNPSMDPFADPAKPEFSDVEVIRRPFTPSLDDELAVRPGDRVHIFRIFDDGWAFVERLAGTERERHERGLIPVDCFREVDQAFPTFLSEKRVSYGSDKLIATAL